MSIANTYIVNRDGTSMVIGSGLYANCYIENQELTEEYQGSSTYRVKIHADRVLPLSIGARVFPQETNGAGGFILLTSPDMEMITPEHFVYDLTFKGLTDQLETVILFNQDAVGWGWETVFSLVGTGQDFVDLIVRNMNRAVPTDSNLELWQAGTVDSTGTTLITFDGDNCMTALKKVSEAFGIPYEVQGNGGFHEYWVSVRLTTVKKRHNHAYSLGSGLSKFKILGESDRKFATALCPLGSTKNIPYDYRGGLKRLHCGNPSPVYTETVFDENTEWLFAVIEKDPATTTYPSSPDNPAHGTTCLEITNPNNVNLGGTKVRFSGSASIDLSGTTLKMWVGTDENWIPYPEGAFTIYLYSGDSLLGSYLVTTMQGGIWKSLLESPYWKEISIPSSAFHCSFMDVDRLEIHIINWGQYGANAYDQVVKFDNIRFEGGGEQQLENFIFGTTYTDAHGKVELIVINEDIFPQLSGSITEVFLESPTQFVDTSMPIDLNEKDGDGNTIYLIPEVTAKVNFISGNLSGYSLAVNWYKHNENKFDLVPYTEESGNVIPSAENAAYSLQVGDEFNITEILPPQAYITDAEQRLYAWALEQYAKYVQPNELADIEIDHVWLYSAATSELEYCYTDDPTAQAGYLPNRFFKAGDLIHILIDGVYDRELMVQSVVQERAQDTVTTYKLTLSSNEPMNITGKMIMSIRELNTKLVKEQQKLGKYFHK